MASVLLLPDPTLFELVDLEIDEGSSLITARARTTSPDANCPVCGQLASRVQSRYVRTLADLPCSGQGVRWLVQVRRFWCDNPACARKIFVERLPSCAPPYARRTSKQAEMLCELAFALGGKAGERIAHLLSMASSHDTLLRLMKRSATATRATPRVLGVDDFAWKKGRRYGTILIDLEAHTVVDVLPDREAATLTKWLKAHPGVQIISRDRAGAYAEGAREGAPQAQQVCDRFHLLLNLQEALKRFFERKHEQLKQIAACEHAKEIQANRAEATGPEPTPQAAKPERKNGSPVHEQERQARREKRKQRYEEVIKLHQQGASQVAIAALIGLDRDTVRHYIKAPAFPEIVRPKRTSKLDPYKNYLHERWAAGQQNVTHLIKEIRTQGYQGGASIVRDYLRDYRTTPQWKETYLQHKACQAQGKRTTPLSAREAAWLFICPPRQLTLKHVRALEPLRLQNEELGSIYHLVQDFRTMVVQRQVSVLPRWLKEAQESGIPELKSFVVGIYRDYDAVRAALSMEWSQGQVEAQVHRLKLIKRQAYGRAKFDLLRQRVLHRSGVTHQETLQKDQKKLPNQQKYV